MRILIVEDDHDLCELLKNRLEREGYDADAVGDGEDALYYIGQHAYDLILLDRMLPGRSGTDILKHMRSGGIQAHVIMTTAMSGIGDRVFGLDAGADDYLVKPYDMDELLARVRAVSRRPAKIEAESLAFSDIELDLTNSSLIGPSGVRDLSVREAALMETLMRNPGQVLKRGMLISKVWGPDADVFDGNLDNYIHFLRRRLGAVSSTVNIKTARGVGYSLVSGSEK